MGAEQAFEVFQEYMRNFDVYKQEFLSEADTRCKFIDKLFTDCLDWQEENIRREVRASSDSKDYYVDYIFKTHVPLLVVEAKRKNHIFVFPGDGKRFYKLDGVLISEASAKDAICQSQRYAGLNSIKYAIVTNGTQFIAFVASRNDGIPWEKSKCVIFRDLEDVKNNFNLFYDLFHRSNIVNNSLEKILFSQDFSTLHNKRLIDLLPQPDSTIFRNQFSDAMNNIIEKFFSDIVELVDSEVFKNCYCLNTEIELYEKNIETLLSDNLPTFIKNAKKIRLKNTENKEEFEEDLESYADGGVTKIPILLIGGLGVGKTTFLRWIFDVKLDKTIKERLFPIFIDFTKGPFGDEKYVEYIEKTIIDALEGKEDLNLSHWNVIKEVYRDLIKREEKGVLKPLVDRDKAEFEIKISQKVEEWKKNSFEYIGRLFEYLAKRKGIKVVIIFDNADQKEMLFQNKIYEYANMFTKKTSCLAVISLREESYWQASRVGIFDAYHTHVYHLRAPRFSDLLEKRLQYALHELRKEAGEYYSSFGSVRVKIHDIKAFFEMIINSIIVSQKGVEILKFIECLACRNMRNALNMFKIFLTSGHTKMDVYIKNYISSKGEYTVPFHEFARSVMMQDFKYYSESRSNIVINIFALGKSPNSSHFTRLRILELLSENKNKSSTIGKGYFEISDFLDFFKNANYEEQYIKDHLSVLLRYNLIETDNNIRDSVDESEYIKITASGEYYLISLTKQFNYLDVVVTDVPILSEEHLKKIYELFYKEHCCGYRKLDVRLAAVDILLNYLQEKEGKEIATMKGASLPDCFMKNFTEQIYHVFDTEKNYILSKLPKQEPPGTFPKVKLDL